MIKVISRGSEFRKNLKCLLEENPKIKSYFPSRSKDDLCFCKTQKGELNLQSKEGYFHDVRGAFLEVKKTLEGIDFKKVDVLCIYGCGLLYFYVYLKEWLYGKRGRHLIFLEDDIYLIEKLLQINATGDFFEDKTTYLYFLRSSCSLEEIFQKIAWEHVFLNIAITALPFYAWKKGKRFLEIKSIFEEINKGVELVASEYSDFGISHFENVCFNYLSCEKFCLVEDVRGKFKDLPAVICGGGPSFAREAHFLRKVQNKALIFAGGAALELCSYHQIVPHFAGGVDKSAPFKSFILQDSWEIPFFFQSQISKENFSVLHSLKLLVGESTIFSFDRWIGQELNLFPEEFEKGWTVTTFLIAIAYFLGCSPIILVGVDLAYEEKERYSQGVREDEGEGKLVEGKDAMGKVVFTQRDWQLAASWIEGFKRRRGIDIINATPRGLLEGIEHRDLRSVFDKIKIDCDLKGLSHAILYGLEEKRVEMRRLRKILGKVDRSFVVCRKYCDAIVDRLEEVYRKGMKNFSLDEISIYELYLQSEMAFRLILSPIWNVWQYVMQRETEGRELMLEKDFIYLLNRYIFLKRVINNYLHSLKRIQEHGKI